MIEIEISTYVSRVKLVGGYDGEIFKIFCAYLWKSEKLKQLPLEVHFGLLLEQSVEYCLCCDVVGQK